MELLAKRNDSGRNQCTRTCLRLQESLRDATSGKFICSILRCSVCPQECIGSLGKSVSVAWPGPQQRQQLSAEVPHSSARHGNLEMNPPRPPNTLTTRPAPNCCPIWSLDSSSPGHVQAHGSKAAISSNQRKYGSRVTAPTAAGLSGHTWLACLRNSRPTSWTHQR